MIPTPEQLQEIAGLREGNLRTTPFAALLLALSGRHLTRVIEMRRKQIAKRIVFEHGVPVDCRSNLVHETLGRYMVSLGKLNPDDLHLYLGQSASRGLPLGEVLLEHDVVTAEELFKLLQQNLAKKVLDVFTWPDGDFRLQDEGPSPESPLKIRVPQLVVTGITKFAPQAEVEAGVVPLVGKKLCLHPQPPFALDEIRLTPRQSQVVVALRSGWRIDELALGTGMPFEEITRLLYALALLGMVITADHPAARMPRAGNLGTHPLPAAASGARRPELETPAASPADPAALDPTARVAGASVAPREMQTATRPMPIITLGPTTASPLPAPTPPIAPAAPPGSATPPASTNPPASAPPPMADTSAAAAPSTAPAPPAAAPSTAPIPPAATAPPLGAPAAPRPQTAAAEPPLDPPVAPAAAADRHSMPEMPAMMAAASQAAAAQAATPPALLDPGEAAAPARPPERRRNEIMQTYLSYRRLDAFDLLGVDEDASPGAVEGKYLETASRFAPWTLNGPGLADMEDKARDIFLAAARAYAELLDLEQRNALLFRRQAKRDERGRRSPADMAIKTDLLDPEVQYRKGRALMDAGKFPEAAVLLEFAADCDPQNGLYSAELAYCRFCVAPAQGARVLKELEETLRRDADCGLAVYYAGEIHRQLGERDEAEKMLRRAIKMMAPDRRPIEALKLLSAEKRR